MALASSERLIRPIRISPTAARLALVALAPTRSRPNRRCQRLGNPNRAVAVDVIRRQIGRESCNRTVLLRLNKEVIRKR